MSTTIFKADATPVWQLAEPDDRPNESWVRLFRAGHLVYEGKPIEVDRAELDTIVSDTNRLIANCEKYAAEAGDDRTPWKPPIMAEHESEGGKTYGRVQTVKLSGDELFGLVQWKESTWEQVLSEDVEFVSPHVVGNYQDSKGEKYKRVLWETSLTTHPKLKDIGRVQDTLNIRLSDNTTITLNEHEGEQMEELVKELMGRFDALEAKIDGLAMGGEEVEAADEEDDIEANEGGDGEEAPATDATPDVAASEKKVLDMLGRFSERLEKFEEAVATVSKQKGLLTEEPGGDGGQPDKEPTTIEGKFAEEKKKGMTAVQASIAARKK